MAPLTLQRKMPMVPHSRVRMRQYILVKTVMLCRIKKNRELGLGPTVDL